MKINGVKSYSVNNQRNSGVKSQPSFKCTVGFDCRIPVFLNKQFSNYTYAQFHYHDFAEKAAGQMHNKMIKELETIITTLTKVGTDKDTFVLTLTPEAIKYIQKPIKTGEIFDGHSGFFYSKNHCDKTGTMLGIDFNYETLLNPGKQTMQAIINFANKYLEFRNLD